MLNLRFQLMFLNGLSGNGGASNRGTNTGEEATLSLGVLHCDYMLIAIVINTTFFFLVNKKYY